MRKTDELVYGKLYGAIFIIAVHTIPMLLTSWL